MAFQAVKLDSCQIVLQYDQCPYNGATSSKYVNAETFTMSIFLTLPVLILIKMGLK